MEVLRSRDFHLYQTLMAEHSAMLLEQQSVDVDQGTVTVVLTKKVQNNRRLYAD